MGYTGGPSRNDARAKRMAEQLGNAPPFKLPPSGKQGTGSTDPRSSSQSHSPGWTGSIPRTESGPPPLTMTKGPRGKVTTGDRYPAQPYAGKFN